jgi:anti-sigma factor RsiW
MDHGAVKKNLPDFYDGELDTENRREVESHLLDCRECRETFNWWKKTSKAFFPKTEISGSEFFVQRVMARVKESAEGPKPLEWHFAWRWLVPAVSVAAAVLIALLPEPSTRLSMDALLFSSQETGMSVLSGKTLTADETLEFVMGG